MPRRVVVALPHPQVPVQRILRTLLRMKMSGEIDDIIRLYTGSSETTP